MIELISPIGLPPARAQVQAKGLSDPAGRRVGFIWNQYQTTRGFWPHLERAVQALCKPASVERAYKPNTWMPLDKERMSALCAQVDYLVIGVGA